MIAYNDPYIPVITPTREHSKYTGRKSVPITGNYDLILISTAHSEYKSIDFTVFNIPVVDTRNAVIGMSENYYKA